MNARDTVIRALSRLPIEASLDDLRREFETALGICEGLDDFAEGRTFGHDEVIELAQQCRMKHVGPIAQVGT